MELDAAELLDALCTQLVEDGASSRELMAIEFGPEADTVQLNTVQLVAGKKARIEAYPDLALILEIIGQTCAQDRISAQQLRRINFLAEEIKLETVSRSGDRPSYTPSRWKTE